MLSEIAQNPTAVLPLAGVGNSVGRLPKISQYRNTIREQGRKSGAGREQSLG